jgi:hypothetical protein
MGWRSPGSRLPPVLVSNGRLARPNSSMKVATSCCWRCREEVLTVGELEPIIPPTVPKEDSPTGLLDTPEGT